MPKHETSSSILSAMNEEPNDESENQFWDKSNQTIYFLFSGVFSAILLCSQKQANN